MAQLTNSAQLDWARAQAAAKHVRDNVTGPARVAAERIISICESAFFTAPEALDIHRDRIRRICLELGHIAPLAELRESIADDMATICTALLITPPAVCS